MLSGGDGDQWAAGAQVDLCLARSQLIAYKARDALHANKA
eukprot:SAG11_NODE_7694_length_1109_cov_1.068317_1_plen_39_part_10